MTRAFTGVRKVAKGCINGISMAGGEEPMLDFASEWWSYGEDEE